MNPLLPGMTEIRKPYLALWITGGLAAMALGCAAWQELFSFRQPQDHQAALPAKEEVGRIPPVPAVSRFLETPGVGGRAVTNLFHSPQVERYLIRLQELKQAEIMARKAALDRIEKAAREELARKKAREAIQEKVREVAASRAAVVVKPPPPRRTRFLYQGLIQSPGEPRLALMAVEPLGKTMPCASGEVCAGAGITNITADTVELILVDGSLRRVDAGKPEFITEELLHACR